MNKINYHQPEYLKLDGIPLDANEFIKEKSKAEYSLGQLQGSSGEGFGKRFFNSNLLISPLSAKEATLSSKIEGTISTVSDVYKYEAGENPQFSGTAEVANYRRAIGQAILHVKHDRKINKSFLKGVHKTLLTGVRHKGILGDFRSDDVWIGERQTDPIEKAIYIPPKALTIDAYMDNLFEFLEKGSEDPLTKIALAHYQFEAIHPFEDGNGRIGRLLIPLFLFERKCISLPILYMSGYFESCRDKYRESLHEVDQTMRYEGWLKFFFNSVTKQVEETLSLIEEINKLFDATEKRLKGSRAHYLLPFLGYVFEHPVFNPTKVAEDLGATYPPISNLIKLFEKESVINLVSARPTSDKRMKLYSFDALLNLLAE